MRQRKLCSTRRGRCPTWKNCKLGEAARRRGGRSHEQDFSLADCSREFVLRLLSRTRPGRGGPLCVRQRLSNRGGEPEGSGRRGFAARNRRLSFLVSGGFRRRDF